MVAPIRLRGVRTHNLKNLDITIPRGAMTVVTGVSGSGKSSLAFDTVYAEGQRRYVESLSIYARQFLQQMPRPPVDEVEHMPPAIAVQQSNPTRTSRSTVGTATEIHDYLRLLFARVGVPHCPGCGEVVRRESTEHVVDRLLTLPEDARFYVAYPLRLERGVDPAEVVAALQQDGFLRALIDGAPVELADAEPKDLAAAASVAVVVDRLARRSTSRARLVDSVELAYRHGDGYCLAQTVDGQVLPFSERFHCAACDEEVEEPAPLHFSFNSPLGACPTCNGFGNTIDLDPALVIRDPQRSLADGAVHPWTLPTHRWVQRRCLEQAPACGVPTDVPYCALTPEQQAFVWDGHGRFPGIWKYFRRLDRKKYKVHVRVFLSRYRRYVPCHACGGARLRPQALSVTVGDRTIAEICGWRVADAATFFEGLELDGQSGAVGRRPLEELRRRLRYLVEVGLSYLTLDRLTKTLSGGEAERIHLATSLGAALTDTLYVLDEPSIGLHARDTDRLVRILQSLTAQGNTVLLVEHDCDLIAAADHILDLGPRAGEQGGQLLFSGTCDELRAQENGSLTAHALQGNGFVAAKATPRPRTHRRLTLEGAREHTLKGIDVEFPLEVFTCVTGVSGSGKSTLVHDVLYAALHRDLHEATDPVGLHTALGGTEYVRDAIMVDQTPIGRTPRSNPITYVQGFNEVRKLFAKTPEAQRRKLGPDAFSFNTGDGRCPRCGGDGAIRVEMHWFADVFIPCDHCDGKRFRSEVLAVKFRNATIHDVLQMTVDEAADFFYDQRALQRKLAVLQATGLGYLRLGQPAPTLSGGEAQRLKLAAHIGKASTHDTLFLFDEPTVGLHLADVAVLLDCFDTLLDRGNSIICIEHHLDVIGAADWIIDLGPEGGDGGGEVVVAGTPEDVMGCAASHTGRCMADHLRRRDARAGGEG